MPRKKKTTTEASNLAAGRRPLPQLAPKITIAPVRHRALRIPSSKSLPKELWRNPISGCYVFGCNIIPCRLRTHQQYDPRKSYKHLSSSEQNRSVEVPPAATTVLGSDIDSLPSLPITTADQTRMRRLLHLHLTRDFHRITFITTPPALSRSQTANMIAVRDATLKQALSDPLYCLNLAISTELQNIYAGQMPDDFIVRLNGEILRLIRTKLDSKIPEDVQLLVVTINTVIQYDLLVNNLAIIKSHRRGLSYLISQGDGPYNSRYTRFIRIFETLDRVIAVSLREAPTFVRRVVRALPVPSYVAERYGSGIDVELQGIDIDVINFCKDCCRGIELMEEEEWSFKMESTVCYNINSSRTRYLYFMRDLIVNEFAHLQARDFSDDAKSCIVLLAAELVQYAILQDYYMYPFARLIADRLQSNLKLCDHCDDWKGMNDALRWIFCVLLCIPTWVGKSWAFNSYLQLLNRLHGEEIWPHDWTEIELRNVSRFVWSDARMGAQMQCVFRQVERTSSSAASVLTAMKVKQESSTEKKAGRSAYY